MGFLQGKNKSALHRINSAGTDATYVGNGHRSSQSHIRSRTPTNIYANESVKRSRYNLLGRYRTLYYRTGCPGKPREQLMRLFMKLHLGRDF